MSMYDRSCILQVAQEGLSGSGVVNTSGEVAARMRSSGLGSYPEIHVPVYAAVKGVSTSSSHIGNC